MKQILLITFLFVSLIGKSQFTFGIKIGGLAFHQQKVSPNYYSWSIDKKGRWVGYLGVSLTAGYQFNPYLGVKIIQTLMPYDCAGKFSGITHVGIDLHDRIAGFKNEKHRLSASFGPMFYYRKNWIKVPNYYVDEGFMNTAENENWERKFIWYGGQIQYDFYYKENQAISTNFLPGFPYIYTFMTGIQTRLE
ncbi:MAG: hypothetical protein GQ574_11625 [Crocinitomix sp.]|nr:hypothetical protein [Crocinitomix sp.]